MKLKRTDNKGRILNTGEYQRPDGRYMYRYNANGVWRCVYSFRLTENDAAPAAKRLTPSLREMEKQIAHDLYDGIDRFGGKITVLELVDKYIGTRSAIRRKTEANYMYVRRKLAADPICNTRICYLLRSDARAFMVRLKNKGLSANTLSLVLALMRPAFKMAVEDDLIRKNPFSFPIGDIASNDGKRRVALSDAEEREFMDFIKGNNRTKKYGDAISFLFKTGLRISEFCGLRVEDLDLEQRVIHVRSQLLYDNNGRISVEETKTSNGARVIPMSLEVYELSERLIHNRIRPENAKTPENAGAFDEYLFYDRKGQPFVARHWQARFRSICRRYNADHPGRELKVSPHICRHTFCSRMALSGMNPKVLQHLMGHAHISITMDTYTHMRIEDARNEVIRVEQRRYRGIIERKTCKPAITLSSDVLFPPMRP